MGTDGLHDKYRVERTDGLHEAGGKHDGCEYFVLDLTHDPLARGAVRFYADWVRRDSPEFAAELIEWVDQIEAK